MGSAASLTCSPSNRPSNRQLVSDAAFSQGLVCTEHSANIGPHKNKRVSRRLADYPKSHLQAYA